MGQHVVGACCPPACTVRTPAMRLSSMSPTLGLAGWSVLPFGSTRSGWCGWNGSSARTATAGWNELRCWAASVACTARRDRCGSWLVGTRAPGGSIEGCDGTCGGVAVPAGRSGWRREGCGQDAATAAGGEDTGAVGDGVGVVSGVDKVSSAVGGAGERHGRVRNRVAGASGGPVSAEAIAQAWAVHEVGPSRASAACTGQRGPVSASWHHTTVDVTIGGAVPRVDLVAEVSPRSVQPGRWRSW